MLKYKYLKNETGTILNNSKEVGLAINSEQTQCMLTSPHQKAEQDRNIKTPNKTFENMMRFKFLGMTLAVKKDADK
jgi:hypothetical protein